MNKKIILLYHTFHREEKLVEDSKYYGRRGSIPVSLLKTHLDWLSQFADFVSLDEIVGSGETENWKVAVTLDDGYRNNLSIALPMFERFDVPVTWFVTTKFVEDDELPWWDLVDYAVREVQPTLTIETKDARSSFVLSEAQDQERFRSQCRQSFQKSSLETASRVRSQIEASINGKLPCNAFASRQEVVEASRSSLVTIGGHTVSHPNLARLSVSNARREIREGKEKLESWVNRPIRWFAFPYGGCEHWNDRTKQIVREEGFDGAVTTVRAYAEQGEDRFEVPRLTVPNTRSLWKTKAWVLATNTCRELYHLKKNWIDW